MLRTRALSHTVYLNFQNAKRSRTRIENEHRICNYCFTCETLQKSYTPHTPHSTLHTPHSSYSSHAHACHTLLHPSHASHHLLGLDKMSHFLLERPPNTQFFHYFGLLSNFCWRRTSALPEGTCFCDGKRANLQPPITNHQHEHQHEHQLHLLHDLIHRTT